jgi:hypothetical protein
MRMRRKIPLVLFLIIVLGVGSWFVIANYGLVFSKNVIGEIVAVERVNENMAVLGGRPIDAAGLFSYAVAIKEREGEIFTASSEDRQWAVAQKGQCAEAKYFPYPPWDFERAGTFHNARLIRLFECAPK